MEDGSFQAPCWAGQQGVGTVMGTMFGFASAALFTPTKDEQTHWTSLPSAWPGVVIGSALGVIAVNASGDRNKHGYIWPMLALGAATVTTLLLPSVPVVGRVFHEAGSSGIVMLAGAASFACTLVLARRDCRTAGSMLEQDHRGDFPKTVNVDSSNLKEV